MTSSSSIVLPLQDMVYRMTTMNYFGQYLVVDEPTFLWAVLWFVLLFLILSYHLNQVSSLAFQIKSISWVFSLWHHISMLYLKHQRGGKHDYLFCGRDQRPINIIIIRIFFSWAWCSISTDWWLLIPDSWRNTAARDIRSQHMIEYQIPGKSVIHCPFSVCHEKETFPLFPSFPLFQSQLQWRQKPHMITIKNAQIDFLPIS